MPSDVAAPPAVVAPAKDDDSDWHSVTGEGDDESEDGDFVLQRSCTYVPGETIASLAACQGPALVKPAEVDAYTPFRIKNTFVHVDDRHKGTCPEGVEGEEAPERSRSDPFGERYICSTSPVKKVSMNAVPENPSLEARAPEEALGGDRNEDPLERLNTYDPFLQSQLPVGGGYPPPYFGMPYQYPPYCWMPPQCGGCGSGPPMGHLHRFHKEIRSFGIASPDFRQFMKGEAFEGRLSVVSGAEIQHGGVQRYLAQFSAGELSKADGIGFVFSSRLPCTKNIQKLVSVFVNQRGRICMRVFGDIVRANAHIRPIKLGDWIEMAVDLESHVLTFSIWSPDPSGWGFAVQADSTAQFHYQRKLIEFNQNAMRPLKLGEGHLACVVQNVGVAVTLGS